MREAMLLGVRKLIEDALEAEVTEASGRGYYTRGEGEARGHRNDWWTGRFKTAEGEPARGSGSGRCGLSLKLGGWDSAAEAEVETRPARCSVRVFAFPGGVWSSPSETVVRECTLRDPEFGDFGRF